MTDEEATKHAKEHLRRHAFPDEDFQWVVGDAKPLDEGWYFDYLFERVKGDGEMPAFAGAIGFIVQRDGSVRDIAYGEWQKLFAPERKRI